MENKDLLKVSSLIITFILFLAGAMMSYWIYALVISNPSAGDEDIGKSIEINQAKLIQIQSPRTTPNVVAEDGYGRTNPFVNYK